MRFWLATALLIGTPTAHAGGVSSCLDRFHLFGSPPAGAQVQLDQTQAELWYKKSSDAQSLAVRPQKRTLSAAKLVALTSEFEHTLDTAKRLRKAGLSTAELSSQYVASVDAHLMAASGILEANGVSHLIRPRTGALPGEAQYEILIERVGDSSMNHLASGLQRLHPDTELIYDPAHLWKRKALGSYTRGGQAALDAPPRLRTSAASILGGIRESVTLRHELQHAYYHRRENQGRLSWMHGRFRSAEKAGFVSPFSEGAYSDYMNFEEVANHEQDLRVLLHQLARSPQDPDLIQASWQKLRMATQVSNRMSEVRRYLEQAIDGLPSTGAEWKVVVDGRTFQVRVSESSEAAFRRLNFQFREVSTSSPLGFDSEILLPVSGSSPKELKSLLESRLLKIREAGSRARSFVQSIKQAVFPRGSAMDPGTRSIDTESVSRIEDLLKSPASRDD